MNCYDLGGHSGCKIILIEEDDGFTFVRKISKDKWYNDRLQKQCEKQASFKGGKIKTPTVYNRGLNEEGLFYFDMEYIQGMTLAEHIKSMEIGAIKGLVESLVSSLIPTTSNETGIAEQNKAKDIFSKKISELKIKLSNKNNQIIDTSLELLEAHDWSKMTYSLCHGDMTLENIIIKNDKMYFIDFLDSFYDSL